MSCQQVSRLITTNATTLATTAAVTTPEDPYVFTETVPTTPPILFNTQKSRCRLTDSHFATTTTTTTKPTSQKLPLTQLNDNVTKTQASALATAHEPATTTTTTEHLKNATQSQKLQHKRITSNVCIVRPQLQQKHREQQQHQQKQHKQAQLLPHTPSLWQTPLLLDTAPAVAVATVSSPTSSATLASPKQITEAVTGASTSTLTTVTAMVSPMVSPSTTPLPPSKFHHTTLAQHLQKVQCLKKPKKTPVSKQPHDAAESKLLVSQTVPPPLQAFTEPAQASQQHSDSSDLNEIPVNVIFRKPQTTSELTRTLLGAAGSCATESAAALKKQTTIVTAVPTATANKLKHVKIIAPTLKVASPLSQSVRPPLVAAGTSAPLKDVVFVQPHAKLDSPIPNHTKTSSKAVTGSKLADVNVIPALIKTTPSLSHAKSEKSLQTDALYVTPPPPLFKATLQPRKTAACKRKSVKFPTIPAALQKKNRKSFASLFINEHSLPALCSPGHSSTAVAVVKLSAAEVDADISLLASATVLPYCLQQHWLRMCDVKVLARLSTLTPNADREDRIAQHKSLLRRQALQLLATRSLQRLPLHAARRRLLCVDRLLRKYRNHTEKDRPVKKCTATACSSSALELAAHCQQHIDSNASQHIFLPCTAKFADNTQCRIPVFDISHDLPLCGEHARKRDEYNRNAYEQRPRKVTAPAMSIVYEEELHSQSHQQRPLQQPTQFYYSKKLTAAPTRKRKATSASPNPVGRPQKRAKKAAVAANASPPQLPLSAVLQRKSSTTSLESITSNSYSSSSQQALQAQQLQQEQFPHQCGNASSSLSPPALAPLSSLGGGSSSRMLNFGASTAVATDLKEHEINEIVTQLAMVAAHNTNANNSILSHSHNHVNSNSSGGNSFNFANTNSNSNFTSSGMGSSSSLPSATDELLTQDMLSICENSSAYASSEDTGLGGLSETELMAAAPDADEIPLTDARFFFDDLANVINAMPADAFNELFTTVHQDEREEVERALELADKHLKTLQQTIGSESDFLGDFLDVNDDILPDADMCSKMEIVSSVMHSPETSNIDSSALFIDGGSSSNGGAPTTNTSCGTPVDNRGLVQT